MRRKLIRAAFVLTFLTLCVILLIPATLAMESLFPVRRRPDGLYPSQDRMPLSVITSIPCVLFANWAASRLFLATGLSKERWSILSRRKRS